MVLLKSHDGRQTRLFVVYSAKWLYKISPKDHSMQRFDQNDGMYTLSTDPVTLFYYHGQMHIGHRSLFTSFDPQKLGQNNNVPNVFITAVSAMGKEVQKWQWTTGFAFMINLMYCFLLRRWAHSPVKTPLFPKACWRVLIRDGVHFLNPERKLHRTSTWWFCV